MYILGTYQYENPVLVHTKYILFLYFSTDMYQVAEWSRQTYPAPLGAGGVGSIPANSETHHVPSFCRWRFEMKLSPFVPVHTWYVLVQGVRIPDGPPRFPGSSCAHGDGGVERISSIIGGVEDSAEIFRVQTD